MNYFDLGIIIIVGLLMLVGFIAGFFKTLRSFFGWFISIILAVLLSKVIAGWLMGFDGISNLFFSSGEGFSFNNWIYGKLPSSFKDVSMDDIRILAAEAKPVDALIELIKGRDSFWGFFLSMFKSSYMTALVGVDVLSYNFTNLAQPIALLMSNTIFVILTGIVLFIVIRIITMIIVHIIDASCYWKKPNILSRFGGMILGAARGFCYVAIIFIILSFAMNFSFMAPVKAELYEKDSVVALKYSQLVFKVTDKLLQDKNIDEVLKASDFKKLSEDQINNDDEINQNDINYSFEEGRLESLTKILSFNDSLKKLAFY